MNGEVDLGYVYIEMANRIKALDGSKDLLAWRDFWMFTEGVALVMRQVEPDEAENFAMMCAEFKDKQGRLLVELEDQVWGKMAEKAAEEGFLSTEDSRRWFKAVCYERGFVLS